MYQHRTSDCNPYGVSVLDSYRHHQGVKLSVDRNHRRNKTNGRGHRASGNEEVDKDKDAFEIDWIGLRPSQVETMDLPPEVFQEPTSNDHKRLDSLLVAPTSSRHEAFAERGSDTAERVRELRGMRSYKVELEALHWKGADYLSRFVCEVVSERESRRAASDNKYNGDKYKYKYNDTRRCGQHRNKRRSKHREGTDRDDGKDAFGDRNHGAMVEALFSSN